MSYCDFPLCRVTVSIVSKEMTKPKIVKSLEVLYRKRVKKCSKNSLCYKHKIIQIYSRKIEYLEHWCENYSLLCESKTKHTSRESQWCRSSFPSSQLDFHCATHHRSSFVQIFALDTMPINRGQKSAIVFFHAYPIVIFQQ